jgi:predicted nucleic acid-binding protein
VAQGLRLVADSSAWIAAFRPQPSATKDLMKDAIQHHVILVPDLVLAEVLRGARSATEAAAMQEQFDNFLSVDIVGKENAVKAAAHYRLLRSKGVTVRGTVDLLIATWCIENDIPILHHDRDFAGFEDHLGLRRWMSPSVGV